MKNFQQYVNEQDLKTLVPMGPAPGEQQEDPDKPKETEVGDLLAALDEIIEIAKRAMNNSGGLAEKSAKKPSNPQDKEPEDRIVAPSADSPEDLFGMK